MLQGGESLFLEAGCGRLSGELDAAECKGRGHPDRLADDLAEALSRTYAACTRAHYGAPLHHNFDKLALLGGESEVCYGSGHLVAPIRVLVNGRVATVFGDERIPYEGWLDRAIAAFFAERLPLLDHALLSVVYNLSAASSPGRVITSGHGGGRQRWFAPRDLEDLRERSELLSNDTSFGTGFAPLTTVQRLARDLSQFLDERSGDWPWLGTDTKVMVAAGLGGRVDAVVCAPQIATFTASRGEYVEHLEALDAAVGAFVAEAFPSVAFSLLLNNRDRLDEDELYLTAIGSSLETGDEGLVGRGNRFNGLITPFSPMNLEGLWGKNPVYHCGKLYNVMAHRIAGDIHRSLGGQVQVNLISATGAPLARPWRVQVRCEVQASIGVIADIVSDQLSRIADITREFLAGELP